VGELLAGLIEAAELDEKITAYAWQQVMGLQLRFSDRGIYQTQASFRAKGHSDCDGTIQLNDGCASVPYNAWLLGIDCL
jgi:hypothetical protein